jgi:hypothetical protein
MPFVDGVDYDTSASFSKEQLLAITANQVAAYLNLKAYGTPTPGPSDRPIHGRSNSLAFQKKAISHFMPLRSMQWDDIYERGNPTRSSAVNDVITKVKKYEVRREGVTSAARRPLEWEEFYLLLVLVRHLYADSDLWFFLSAVFCLQWQIIGRIDDVMKLAKSTVLFNRREPSTLCVKMSWSKNITEERESPTQILFGAMDPLICPLLNLAAWLEGGEDSGSLLFCAHRSNRFVSSVIQTIFNSNLFHSMKEGLLGTHSVRKGAASYAARFGIVRDWIMCRGRWRGKKRQVDTYIEIDLPYPDARVASILTGPRGPCKYAVKGGTQISDEVIRSLVPKIYSAFGGDIASVLVLPLLWAAYEENMTVNGYTLPIIPPSLTSAIKERWIAAGNSPVENPIEKISLGVQQFGDQLVIVPIRHPGKENGVVAARTDGEEEEHAGADGGVAPATNAGSEGYWAGKSEVELLFSQQFQMQQRIEDLCEEMNNLFTVQKLYLRKMNTNVKGLLLKLLSVPILYRGK